MHIFERGYQIAMGAGMKLLPASKQELIRGPGSLARIPALLQQQKLAHPLIVTGPRVSQTDFFQRLVLLLQEAGMEPAVFNEVEPDPTTDLVERVMEVYRAEGCDCFIALGGGSNMDAAKAAAAGIAQPEKTLAELAGVMKVRRKTPYLIAVPTTAGTGSECTVAAVITDSRTHRKFAINDPVLCPDAAVLDAELTAGLPAAVVASTGMDALTHAVEAYLNRMYHKPGTGQLGASIGGAGGKISGAGSRGQSTAQLCLQAVHDIMLYLPFVYVDPSNARARQKLLEASYMAGQAFTVACVGNVHAIAHTLGGLYHIPHGVANAVLLPVVLEDYGSRVWRPLARLARAAGLDRTARIDQPGRPGQNNKTNRTSDTAMHSRELAEAFIEQLRRMNREMGIPEGFEEIREADLEKMAGWATQEANPLYPVPVIYDKSDVKRILMKIKKEPADQMPTEDRAIETSTPLPI